MKVLPFAVLLVAGYACGADLIFQALVHAQENAAEWLTYWGDYHATRFRKLNQITDRNVGKLRLEWMYQTDAPGAFETVPLVSEGVMYLTTPDTAVLALDARSGRQLWRFQYRIPKNAKYCCGNLNRGLGMLGNNLYCFTPDTRLLAIDKRDGTLVLLC